MDVSLVAYVEQQLVLGSIEHRVQRQRQLNHAQVRAQMATSL
jgi:hypothetical protein